MILITGSTGHLGSAVIEQLLKQTSTNNIVAFARDKNKAKELTEKGIEVRLGTFEDINSLNKAMQGIKKVLLISTVDHHRFEQHKNVIDAAKKAGVKYIGYTSVLIKEINLSPVKVHLESHFQTENYIKRSGLNYSFFRNTLYSDMVPIYVGQRVFDKGIYLPAGNGKVAYALRREMGEAIANAFLTFDGRSNIYEITGTKLYSYDDISKILTECTGRQINYTDADPVTFPDMLRQLGVSEQMIIIASGFSSDIRNHQYEIVSKDLENLLGRKPTSLPEALKELYNF